MGQNKKGVLLYPDHKLVTRRDFLAAGVIDFAALTMFPTLFQLFLSKRAVAAPSSCPDQTSANPSPLPPFMQLNLAGGAMLAANFVPRDLNGDLISSYSLMGMGSRSLMLSPSPVTGNPVRLVDALGVQVKSGQGGGFFERSGLLAGLNQARNRIASLNPTDPKLIAARDFMDKTACVGFVVNSRDDSNANRFDLAGLVTRAGFTGTKLANIKGSSFSQSPAITSAPAPLLLQSYNDIVGALSPRSGPYGTMTTAQVAELFKTVRDLSDVQTSMLSGGLRDQTRLGDAIYCGAENNRQIASAPLPPGLDPRTDTALQAIWQINGGSQANSQAVIFASAASSTIKKLSGCSRVELGGYDYHNNTRTTGDAQDTAAGNRIGQLLQTAAALGQKLFLYVSTDGATVSANSATSDTTPWTSDRGNAGLVLVFVYDPVARPSIGREDGVPINLNQVGYLDEGQAAARNEFIPGWDAERAAVAVFANYLRWHYGSSQWRAAYDAVMKPLGMDGIMTSTDLSKTLRVLA